MATRASGTASTADPETDSAAALTELNRRAADAGEAATTAEARAAGRGPTTTDDTAT